MISPIFSHRLNSWPSAPSLSCFRHILTSSPTFSSSLPNLNASCLRRTRPNQTISKGTCRAQLSDDAPFAVAIGACMLTSLVFPITSNSDEDADSAIDSTDTRFAVMGIVSFIPYFNWLSWVFAWLDTGKRRYAVYSLVYLVPYLRTNLSLSPEESWLPISSIVFCIIHIQLEASIRNGDIEGLQFLREVVNQLSFLNKRKDHLKGDRKASMESRTREMNLPSACEKSRELERWGDPEKPLNFHEHLDEDSNDDDKSKH
ncbi:Zinc finger matrin-type protein [Quillaja saponaria]|uniref:Zinc finger matrin-type protein n=1 Tax=Quillaja saponaria TaxID=32244 RepID=A0AAD7KS76_QUISA|nr:Zinc finger matrin-type protein [Quillaja saponaria]